MSRIEVRHLGMTFRAPIREAGLRAALASLVKRQYRAIPAVQDMSFVIEAGELVGFIGPNGAGKTTTLKMLSGILHPTQGQAQVLGFTPWKRESAFLRQIALIRGSQPLGGPGELTVMDALRFQQLIYELPDADFKRSLAELVTLLSLEPLLTRQVRALSLGERMRSGLALALIYRPQVLFLDEPTIGLDVSGVRLIRHFLREYCRTTRATMLLTSHYMADVETLCNRIVLIDKGRLTYDGGLHELSRKLSPYKLLRVSLRDTTTIDCIDCIDWNRYGELLESDDNMTTLRVPREQAATLTAQLLAEQSVVDLAVAEPPLEQVIDRIYMEGVA